MLYSRISAVFVAVSLLMTAGLTAAYAQFNVLYDFGKNGGDPLTPLYQGLVAQGCDGNLYSATPSGGAKGFGAVFQITTAGALTVLHSFTGPRGSTPIGFGGLTLGWDCNFYGTSWGDGTSEFGTLFQITPAGTFNVLYNFTGGADGGNPYAPPIQATDGNFYGTTGHGNGTVYKYAPATGTLTTIYKFPSCNVANECIEAPLVQGLDGNFYSTSTDNGLHNLGMVYRVTPVGKFTAIHNFEGTDGALPVSGLVQGTDGKFYGVTFTGGTNACPGIPGPLGTCGVIFKISSGGGYTVLRNLSSSDGGGPGDGLVQAFNGKFFGTTTLGGTAGYGTFFVITPTGTFAVLDNFDGTHGGGPEVVPVEHTNGVFYSDTTRGGSIHTCPGGCGVFYSINRGIHPFVKLLPATGKVGSQIGILGQGFNSTSIVRFNGVKATTITVVSPNFILATVPLGTLDGYVIVKTGTDKLVSLQQFIVHDSWGLGAPMPTARAGGAIGVIKGKIYVVSGEIGGGIVGNNEIYDPTTGVWTTGKAIPTPVFVPASAVVNNILYVMGGIANTITTAPTNFVQAYNPDTNSWTAKTTMPTPMDSMNAVVDGGFIYVIGGYDGSKRSAVVQRYDPATDTWASPPPAPLLHAKSDSAVGVIGSTIVSAGGLDNVVGASHDVEGYSPKTNMWKALESDPTQRDLQCGATVGSLLYVVGGSTTAVLNTTTLTESYNMSTNKWTTLSPALFAQDLAMPAVVNGQLFCIGGTDNGLPFQGTMFNFVQTYQP